MLPAVQMKNNNNNKTQKTIMGTHFWPNVKKPIVWWLGHIQGFLKDSALCMVCKKKIHLSILQAGKPVSHPAPFAIKYVITPYIKFFL